MFFRLKKGDFIFILEVCLFIFKRDIISDCVKVLSLDYGKKIKVEVGFIRFCYYWVQKVLRNSFYINIFLFFEKQLYVFILEFIFIEIVFEENLN